jgi:hypothetical protein
MEVYVTHAKFPEKVKRTLNVQNQGKKHQTSKTLPHL